MRLLFLQTVLFPANTGSIVNSALPRTGLCTVLGGTAAPVVFDSGLAWSAFCKENLAPPPIFTQFYFDWANLGRLGTPLMSMG